MYNANNGAGVGAGNAREFQVRSKEDARVFLSEVAQFGSVRIPDLNNPGHHFIVSRDGRKNSVAVVGYEPDDRSWYEAVSMYGGERAVELIFTGRRSINKHLRSA